MRDDWERGVRDEADQQAIRIRDWMLDPSYGTWVGPVGSTLSGGPFRAAPTSEQPDA